MPEKWIEAIKIVKTKKEENKLKFWTNWPHQLPVPDIVLHLICRLWKALFDVAYQAGTPTRKIQQLNTKVHKSQVKTNSKKPS